MLNSCPWKVMMAKNRGLSSKGVDRPHQGSDVHIKQSIFQQSIVNMDWNLMLRLSQPCNDGVFFSSPNYHSLRHSLRFAIDRIDWCSSFPSGPEIPWKFVDVSDCHPAGAVAWRKHLETSKKLVEMDPSPVESAGPSGGYSQQAWVARAPKRKRGGDGGWMTCGLGGSYGVAMPKGNSAICWS